MEGQTQDQMGAEQYLQQMQNAQMMQQQAGGNQPGFVVNQQSNGGSADMLNQDMTGAATGQQMDMSAMMGGQPGGTNPYMMQNFMYMMQYAMSGQFIKARKQKAIILTTTQDGQEMYRHPLALGQMELCAALKEMKKLYPAEVRTIKRKINGRNETVGEQRLRLKAIWDTKGVMYAKTDPNLGVQKNYANRSYQSRAYHAPLKTDEPDFPEGAKVKVQLPDRTWVEGATVKRCVGTAVHVTLPSDTRVPPQVYAFQRPYVKAMEISAPQTNTSDMSVTNTTTNSSELNTSTMLGNETTKSTTDQTIPSPSMAIEAPELDTNMTPASLSLKHEMSISNEFDPTPTGSEATVAGRETGGDNLQGREISGEPAHNPLKRELEPSELPAELAPPAQKPMKNEQVEQQ